MQKHAPATQARPIQQTVKNVVANAPTVTQYLAVDRRKPPARDPGRIVRRVLYANRFYRPAELATPRPLT